MKSSDSTTTSFVSTIAALTFATVVARSGVGSTAATACAAAAALPLPFDVAGGASMVAVMRSSREV
jgi:hypothetical protein